MYINLSIFNRSHHTCIGGWGGGHFPRIYTDYPRANGAKRLLIPHGYLHPGKSEHSEV